MKDVKEICLFSNGLFAVFFVIICICALIGWPVWFGFFFGVNYPEIVVATTYQDSTCVPLKHIENPYTCCFEECPPTSCQNPCAFGSPTCSYAVNHHPARVSGWSLPCCSNKCCRHVERCTYRIDSDGDSVRECRTVCDQHVDLNCMARCYTCYRPSVEFEYEVVSQETGERGLEVSTVERSCGRDYQCVEAYFGKYPIGTENECFYNPRNTKQITFSKDYTTWKWILFGFFSIVPACCLFCTCIAIIALPIFCCVGHVAIIEDHDENTNDVNNFKPYTTSDESKIPDISGEQRNVDQSNIDPAEEKNNNEVKRTYIHNNSNGIDTSFYYDSNVVTLPPNTTPEERIPPPSEQSSQELPITNRDIPPENQTQEKGDSSEDLQIPPSNQLNEESDQKPNQQSHAPVENQSEENKTTEFGPPPPMMHPPSSTNDYGHYLYGSNSSLSTAPNTEERSRDYKSSDMDKDTYSTASEKPNSDLNSNYYENSMPYHGGYDQGFSTYTPQYNHYPEHPSTGYQHHPPSYSNYSHHHGYYPHHESNHSSYYPPSGYSIPQGTEPQQQPPPAPQPPPAQQPFDREE